MRKIILTLSSSIIAISPIATVIACGNKSSNKNTDETAQQKVDSIKNTLDATFGTTPKTSTKSSTELGQITIWNLDTLAADAGVSITVPSDKKGTTITLSATIEDNNSDTTKPTKVITIKATISLQGATSKESMLKVNSKDNYELPYPLGEIDMSEVTTTDEFMNRLDYNLKFIMPMVGTELIKFNNIAALKSYFSGIRSTDVITLKNGSSTYTMDFSSLNSSLEKITKILNDDSLDKNTNVGAFISAKLSTGQNLLPEILGLINSVNNTAFFGGLGDYLRIYDTEQYTYSATMTNDEFQTFIDAHPYITMLKSYHSEIWKLANSDFYKSWANGKSFNFKYGTNLFTLENGFANYISTSFNAGEAYDSETFINNNVSTAAIVKHGDNNDEVQLSNLEALFAQKLYNIDSVADSQSTKLVGAQVKTPENINGVTGFENFDTSKIGSPTERDLTGTWNILTTTALTQGVGQNAFDLMNDVVVYMRKYNSSSSVIFYRYTGINLIKGNDADNPMAITSLFPEIASFTPGKPNLIDTTKLPVGWKKSNTKITDDRFHFYNLGQAIYYDVAEGNSNLNDIMKIRNSMMYNSTSRLVSDTLTSNGSNKTEMDAHLNGATSGDVTTELIDLIKVSAKWISYPSNLNGVNITYNLVKNNSDYTFTFTYSKGSDSSLNRNLKIKLRLS